MTARQASGGDGAGSLRRSLLFVPGGEAAKLEKALGGDADTLLIDLEDSVALPEKERARETVLAFLGAAKGEGPERCLRVNPPGTPWFADDLEAAVRAGVAAIVLPKSERVETLRQVAERLAALESAGPGDVRVGILALVESAAGIARGVELAQAGGRLEALCFGHADFTSDMGLAEADASRGVVYHARCQLALAARAGGVAAIDTICLDVRDEVAIRSDTELGRSLGFQGKLCIHPLQVGIANAVHTPTLEEIAHARRVLDAAREAEQQGRGVFTVDGKMVDAPVIAAQQRVLERARRAGVAQAGEGGAHGA